MVAKSIIEDPIALGYPDWGRGSIRDYEWEVIKEIIQKHNVKTILEIGIGLSTLLMMQVVDRLIGYDSWPTHIEFMKTRINDNAELHLWDGKTPFKIDEQFDMAFIDGPQGALNRRPSFWSAINNCKILSMHDTGQVWNDEWRFEFDPEGKFKPLRPGSCLSFWIREE